MELNELCVIKGDSSPLKVVGIIEEDGVVTGYQVRDKNYLNHWYRAEELFPPKKKRGRKKRPQSSEVADTYAS